MRVFYGRGEKQRIRRFASELAPALTAAFAHDQPAAVQEAHAREIAAAVKPVGLLGRPALLRRGSAGEIKTKTGKISMMPGSADKETVGHEVTHAVLRKLHGDKGVLVVREFIPDAVFTYLMMRRLRDSPVRIPAERLARLDEYVKGFNEVWRNPFASTEKTRQAAIESAEPSVSLGMVAHMFDYAVGNGAGLFLMSRIVAGKGLGEAMHEVAESDELRKKIAEWGERHGRVLEEPVPAPRQRKTLPQWFSAVFAKMRRKKGGAATIS